jgi:two-component system chemotaxis response regulator CheY
MDGKITKKQQDGTWGGAQVARILVVDDAAFMRMMLSDILRKAGHEVVGEAENGAVAVDKYGKLHPDLVMMDITMPEMEGIEALKHIRQADPGAKVIMCSAMGQQMMVVNAIQAGAKDFIVKPFQPERVLESISRVLSGN